MLTLRSLLPYYYTKLLFGDRRRYGKIPPPADKDWIEWNNRNTEIYHATGRENRAHDSAMHAGYKILGESDKIKGKVLEIGPGNIDHLSYWDTSKVEKYTIVDIRDEMLTLSTGILDREKISNEGVKINREDISLPLDSDSFDCVISFYALEHIVELEKYIAEIKRVLKNGGLFIGGIPAEGGLGWGLGRYLTSRVWFKKNTNIDLYKIICWEHVNYSDEIMRILKQQFKINKIKYWPLRLPIIDMNLIISYEYECNK